MPLESLVDKWKAFGWDVIEMNGDEIEDIVKIKGQVQKRLDKYQIILENLTKIS